MILIGLGANLPSAGRTPAQTLQWALARLENSGISIECRSETYETAPMGPGVQASYFNLVARIGTHRPPAALLTIFHRIEHEAGRGRGSRWIPRPLDIDLLAWHDAVLGWDRKAHKTADRPPPVSSGRRPIVPHPGLGFRPFVVGPLMEIAPDWHHPATGETVRDMWRRLRRKQEGRIIDSAGACARR